MDVPENELDPPEPRRTPTFEEWLDHEQDRLIDEARLED
jgi:hypothetical protein